MSGWIDWMGGSMPVEGHVVVSVQYEGPIEHDGGPVIVVKTRNAEDFRWEWAFNGKGADIRRYKIEDIQSDNAID